MLVFLIFATNFIETKTEGFDALQQHLLVLDIESLSKMCGIDMAQIKEVAAILKEKSKVFIKAKGKSIGNVKSYIDFKVEKGEVEELSVNYNSNYLYDSY